VAAAVFSGTLFLLVFGDGCSLVLVSIVDDDDDSGASTRTEVLVLFKHDEDGDIEDDSSDVLVVSGETTETAVTLSGDNKSGVEGCLDTGWDDSDMLSLEFALAFQG
jgi:hypothetical protein